MRSDVYGKLSLKSAGGAEHFVTFTKVFQDWKSMVGRSTGQKLKVLWSDNGSKYTSGEFDQYLRSEGIRHDLTVPKSPQHNGVAECLSRTLVEMTSWQEMAYPRVSGMRHCRQWVYLRNCSPTKAVKSIEGFSWKETRHQTSLSTWVCVLCPYCQG